MIFWKKNKRETGQTWLEDSLRFYRDLVFFGQFRDYRSVLTSFMEAMVVKGRIDWGDPSSLTTLYTDFPSFVD